jgi:hypothetical protein
MALAGRPHPRPVARRGRAGRGAADGLGDHRSHVLFVRQHVLQVAGAAQGALPATAGRDPGALGGIRRGHVLRACQQGADALAEKGFPAHGDGLQRGPVEGAPEGHGLEPSGGHPGELQGHAHGGGPPGGEEDFLQAPRGEFPQALGQFDGRPVGVAPGAEGEALELAHDGRDHLRVAEAHLVDAVAVEIEEAAPLKVLDAASPAGGQHVEAGGGQGLAQEDGLVGRQPAPGLGIEVLPFPAPPPGGAVGVPLAHLRGWRALLAASMTCSTHGHPF